MSDHLTLLDTDRQEENGTPAAVGQGYELEACIAKNCGEICAAAAVAINSTSARIVRFMVPIFPA